MNKLLIPFFFLTALLYSQESNRNNNFSNYLLGEILGGNTFPATYKTPKMKNEKGFVLHFGKYSDDVEQEWAYRLNYPSTGVSIGIIDYGNPRQIGHSFLVMPFYENNLLKIPGLYANAAIGTSLFTKKYSATTNPDNTLVTTRFNWAFRLFLHYSLISTKGMDWRIGFGYYHQSNGHIRLPNEGLNSLFASTSFKLNYQKKSQISTDKDFVSTERNNYQHTYFSFRTGIGQNVLSKAFNDPKEIYSVAISIGRVNNKTIRYGVGLYYRFYEHYYDYIKSEGELIKEYYLNFRDNPFLYSTNLGFFGSFEVLFNHVGAEIQIGYNIFKPAYKIDRQLGQSYTYMSNGEEIFEYGALDMNYELKRSISARIGLKYYFLTTNNDNTFNVFLGANLNANFGQADFNELSLGIVYNYNFKKE